jgi:hypothetical protein
MSVALKELMYAVSQEDDSKMVPVKIKELRYLLMAVEMLRMTAGDMHIYKGVLTVERKGRFMMRKSDIEMVEELSTHISNAVGVLTPLGLGDIYADDVGEFVFDHMECTDYQG